MNLQVAEIFGEPMGNDSNRMAPYLLEEWSGVLEKGEIGIEIGQQLDIRVGIEKIV
jgi:hypothetical protein